MNSPLLLINTLIGSIRQRGLLRTGRLVVDELLVDRRLGIDTGGLVDVRDMETGGHDVTHAQPYMPTAHRTFAEIVARLDRGLLAGRLIDYGSGKGRVVVLAALSGFAGVTGIEFDHRLCAIAQRNLAKLDLHGRTAASVVHTDARRFAVPEDATVFYFYNPFSEEVLEEVLGRVRESLQQTPRRHTLVYMNPVCHQLVESAGFRLLSRHESAVGQAFNFYELPGNTC